MGAESQNGWNGAGEFRQNGAWCANEPKCGALVVLWHQQAVVGGRAVEGSGGLEVPAAQRVEALAVELVVEQLVVVVEQWRVVA